MEVALVLLLSALILIVSGVITEEGPNSLANVLILVYFPIFVVTISFFGGVHGASEFGTSVAFTVAVFTQNVLLWYLIWRVRQHPIESRDT